MCGIYVLVFEITRPAEIQVGKLGRIRFAPGTYAYVGSALGGIEARVARHPKREKHLRWHIDYLLSHPGVAAAGVYVWETTERRECEVAQMLAAEYEVVPGFGSSDCRCRGHLFRCELRRLGGILEALGFQTFRLPKLRCGHRGRPCRD
jgi:Uri superfamily endonuclease